MKKDIWAPCGLQFLDPATRSQTDFDKVIDEFNETRPEGSKCAKGQVGCAFDENDNITVTGDDDEMAGAFAEFLSSILDQAGQENEQEGRSVRRRAKETVN